MLRYLDSQVGRPMSLTRAENLHKEPDDIITYVLLSLCLSVCLSVTKPLWHEGVIYKSMKRFYTAVYDGLWYWRFINSFTYLLIMSVAWLANRGSMEANGSANGIEGFYGIKSRNGN